jgi:ubiquinone/menaquinone biosynthesis C-methylase UbiE
MIKSWLDFWNAANRIYVSRRHREAHFDTIFARVRPFLPARPDGIVLDWGCGDALAAGRMAEICGTVQLYDGASAVRARLVERHQGHPSVQVLDDSDLDALAPGSVDFVMVISVIQYLDKQQLATALARFHRLVKRDGSILIGDVIEPDTQVWRDAANLLRFGLSEGFFLAALVGMLSTFASPYRRLRREMGFSRYTPKEILHLLEGQGFSGESLPVNVAPSRQRRSYLGRKMEL